MANEPLEFGQYYHVYNRGNNREKLFVEERNYPYFLDLYAKYILPIADTFAYCLLSNHFHFFIRTYTEEEQETYWREQQEAADEESGPISQIGPLSSPATPPVFKLRQPSRAFNNMFIAYARALNKATGRTGALFESPFGRKPVADDVYYRNLVVYIHQNPQLHGFVDDFRAWTWSSYNAFFSMKPTNIKRTAVVDWFDGPRQFESRHIETADRMQIAELVEDDD